MALAQVVALAEPKLTGAQLPRIEVIPAGEEHPRWQEIVEFVAATGTVLDEWQLRVLWAACLRRAGLWAAFVVAVCCPRQNGKNGILEMRELVGACLLGERLIIHSAHLADTSMEGFRRLDDLIDANSWLSKQVKNIRRQNGHEQITFTNGSRIRFRTRTRGGGRGFSSSPVIFDESMFLPEVSMGSILPVVSAQEDPQVWHMGSAVDQAIHEDGVVFARVREQALSENLDDRIAYFEWSLDAKTPDEVTSEQISSLELWAETNPAFGVRIMPEYLRAELRALDQRTFAVERLGVGDWPRTDGLGHMVINPNAWDALADRGPDQILEPVFFTFDVAPDRSRSATAITGRRSDGLVVTEIDQHKAGTGWVPERLAELARNHSTDGILCDAASPAASLVHDIEALGPRVRTLDAREYAHACGVLFDAVDQRTLRHGGTPELASALRGVGTRSLADAWAWSRKSSSTDITPLVACTIGVWAVMTKPSADMFIAFG